MKYALILLAFATSASSAFAVPAYLCQPSEINLAPLKIFVKSRDQVSFATIVDGNQVPEIVLDRKNSLDPPQGYSAFFATGGCNQDGRDPHCFAIWQHTLILSNGMLKGTEDGSANLNGEDYRCELQ